MVDHLINFVSGLGHWGYFIIFLGVLLESAAFFGFIVPGETLVLLGGFLAAQGTLDLGDLMIWVVVGAILGDSIGYLTGRHLGREQLLRIGKWVRLRAGHLEKVEQFFDRHGGKTVFFGRFVALLRAMTPFVAGSSGMHWGRFLLYNAAGGIIWGVGFVLAGYFLGTGWRYAGHWIGETAGGIAALIALLLLLGWVWRWLNRREWAIKHWWAALMRRPGIAAARQRFGPRLLKLEAKLTPWVTLAIYLLLGLVVLAGAGGAFVFITRRVLAGIPLDAWIDNWLHAHAARPLITFFIGVSVLGSKQAVAVITLGVGAALILWRRWHWLLELILVVGGGLLLNEVLKIIFHRQRPHFSQAFVHPQGYSFPSGHAVGSTLIYGLLAVFAVQLLSRWKWRTLSVLVALALILLIGFSRIYLGAHYSSDVLGGYAEGVAWLAICVTGVEAHRHVRRTLISADRA